MLGAFADPLHQIVAVTCLFVAGKILETPKRLSGTFLPLLLASVRHRCHASLAILANARRTLVAPYYDVVTCSISLDIAFL